MTATVRAWAPGRVNLIGDHTDHMGGLALPCAIDLGVTITGERSETIDLRSAVEDVAVVLDLPMTEAPPITGWGRYVAAVARLVPGVHGLRGIVESDLPIGAGLSSSAALEVAVALALGFEGPPMELALLAQRAEHAATDTPTGLLDQLAITHGRSDHALCIDFGTLAIEAVPVPDDVDIVIVHSGETRTVEGSAYSRRVDACRRAAALVGPLPTASLDDITAIEDAELRRRALHVRTECDRVRSATESLRSGDMTTFGGLMVDSHRSLRDEFEVSTPRLDALVTELLEVGGVYGARLTGAGFGGCVVAVSERGAIDDPARFSGRGWIVRASGAAHVR